MSMLPRDGGNDFSDFRAHYQERDGRYE